MEMRKSKKSILDSRVPDNYSKIKFKTGPNNRKGIPLDLKVHYCTIGLCNSKFKPCINFSSGDYCPYQTYELMERPRSNSKQYQSYLDEYNLQMTLKVLNDYIDDDIEKAIYGELDNETYNKVVLDLSKKLNKFMIKSYASYNKIFRDINIVIIEETKKLNEKAKSEEEYVFEINDYFLFIMPIPPNILDENGKSYWHSLSNSSVWIKKDKLTSDFWSKFECESSSRMSGFYQSRFRSIKAELESKYGLITMLKLTK